MSAHRILQAVVGVLVAAVCSTSNSTSSSSIVFPSSDMAPFLPPLRTTGVPRCASLDDPDAPCEEDPEYDNRIKDHVRHLLALPATKALLTDPLLKGVLQTTPPALDARTRFNQPSIHETPMCMSTPERIPPKRAKNLIGEYVFVVNQEEFPQYLWVEKCVRPGKPCDFGPSCGSDINMEFTCTQKYINQHALVFDEKKVFVEKVLLPSACVCVRKPINFDIASRTGLSGNASQPDEATQPTSLDQPLADQPFNPSLMPTLNFNQPTTKPFHQPETFNINNPRADQPQFLPAGPQDHQPLMMPPELPPPLVMAARRQDAHHYPRRLQRESYHQRRSTPVSFYLPFRSLAQPWVVLDMDD